MVAETEEVKEGDNYVNRAADDADDLVAVENGSKRHNPRRVCLDNPDGIVNYVFAFEALELKVNVDHQGVVGSCLDTCQQLKVLAKERIARPWEALKSNLVRRIKGAVQVPALPVEHPLVLLPERFVFRKE